MKYSLVVIAVLFVSGCAQFQGFFGQDVLTINRKVSEEGFKDVLVLKDAKSIPSSPVLPDQQILFSFIVESIDKTETAKNVIVDLFNAPLFKDTAQKQLCNQKECLPDFCGKGKACSVLPGEQRAINFELLAPGEEEIARIKTDTELSYKVSYDFRGNLLYSVPVVNQEEIRSLQRQGKSVALTEQITHGSGPLQVDVQLFGTPYLLSDFKGIFIFTVKNKGKGNVVNSQIGKEKLVIEFPLELFADGGLLTTPDGIIYSKVGTELKTPQQEQKPGEQRFKCESTVSQDILTGLEISLPRTGGRQVLKCWNIRNIELFRDETRTTMRFEISKVAKISEPFKTYLIRALVDYKYELRDSFPITIRPFEK